MQIELTQDEIKTIREALEIWQNEKPSGVMAGAILGSIMCGEGGQEEFQAKIEKKMEEARAEADARKCTSILLQAKLLTALFVNSTRTTDSSTAPA